MNIINKESCDIDGNEPIMSNDRERALLAEGMTIAIMMLKHKSLIFMPYSSIRGFAQSIEDGDSLAKRYIDSLYEDKDNWPQELK